MPSLTVKAASPRVKHPNESILFGADFTRLLATGETLSAPAVAVSPAGPTITAIAVNTATFVNDDGETVAIGQGVRFRVAGGTAGTDYTLTVDAATSAGNTRTIVCELQVRTS